MDTATVDLKAAEKKPLKLTLLSSKGLMGECPFSGTCPCAGNINLWLVEGLDGYIEGCAYHAPIIAQDALDEQERQADACPICSGRAR
jgi:hypothetical protein